MNHAHNADYGLPTVADLDALAMGAIVLTSGGTCFIKIGYDGLVYGGEWRSPYKVPALPPHRGEFVDSTYVSKVVARILYDPNAPTSPGTTAGGEGK